MATALQILRTAIHTFLRHYNYFTFAAILSLPFSISTLISSSLSLHSLFDSNRFPPESQFFNILNSKLSHTISSSILVIPFSLSFLLISKSFIIRSFNTGIFNSNAGIFNSIAGIFKPILQTQIWNTFIILSANATCFWVLFIAFNFLENLHIPSLLFTISGGIVYSVVITNAMITCNLALILSGIEMDGGLFSFLKSCVMIRGRTSLALALALPVNMALAGIEFLFRFRVVKAYSDSGVNTSTKTILTMVLEGILIAYLYSVVITIDGIIGCVFFKSCKINYDRNLVDEEAGRVEEKEDVGFVKCLAKDLS